jgi:hypothetical protein
MKNECGNFSNIIEIGNVEVVDFDSRVNEEKLSTNASNAK